MWISVQVELLRQLFAPRIISFGLKMLLLLSLIGVAFCFILMYYHTKLRPMMKKAENIPGPKTLPLIGNALEFGHNTKAFFEYLVKLSEEHGPIARVWIGPILGVLLTDPHYVEIVMGSNKHVNKSTLYKFGEPWLGRGMLTNKGTVWKRHKKIVASAFSIKVLDKFITTMNDNTKIFLKLWESHVDKEQFDVYPYFNLVTLDVICESAMGIKINAQMDRDSEYVQAVQQLGDAMFIRAFKPWLHPDIIFALSSLGSLQKNCLKVLHGMTNDVIQKRKQFLNSSSENEQTVEIKDGKYQDETGVKQKHAFLDLMLQGVREGAVLSDEELREEVDTIMLAGHDTTCSSLSFTCWLLAKHHDVQEKCVMELKDIFGDSDRNPTCSDLQEMKYMETVIKESLRLFPSVPMFGRYLTEDVPIGDGYILPAGTNIAFNPFGIHRNPKFYPDPEKFDPDRFLPENSSGRHPYSYIAFSGGPRGCLGIKFAMMEMKVILSGILRKFKLLPPDPNHKLDLTITLVLKSLTGIPIRLQYRR